MRQQFFKGAKRVVIKIGTSVVAEHDIFHVDVIKGLVSDLAQIQKETGVEVIFVSSGAIGAGLQILRLKKRPKEIEKLQAIAAIGQRRLVDSYAEAFEASGILCAQLLLTWDDLGSRVRFKNTKRTIEQLMRYRCVPMINENDTVATEEIQFGDNDQLSAMVSILFEADLLIILSDSNGLYADVAAGDDSRIAMVDDLNASIFERVRDLKRAYTKGGMKAKLEAIEKAVDTGIPCLLASGRTPRVLKRLFEGEDLGTLFLPKIKKTPSKRHWIAYVSRPEGTLVVDAGAKEALLRKGKSLLSKGILRLRGHFEPGSAVQVEDEAGKQLGKGIVNFSSAELAKIKGVNSKEWSKILDHACMDEVLHRDNFVKGKGL